MSQHSTGYFITKSSDEGYGNTCIDGGDGVVFTKTDVGYGIGRGTYSTNVSGNGAKITMNISHTHTIGAGNTEGRPINMSISIWKRVS